MKRIKFFLVNFEEIIGSFFLSVLLLLTIVNVFIRFLTGRSYVWTEEISFLCFAWVIFIGASAVYKRGLHSSIDIVVQLFPERVKRIVSFCTCLLMFAAIIFVAYLSVKLAYNAVNKFTPILFIPYSVVDLSIVIGFSLMTIHCAGFLKNILKYSDYQDRPLYKGL
ncbi:MAG: TRAP transporter small permease, partial [Treponema sp.]|nr:TRAP transporter small permease [Treponema sp.]